jgi:hypothetical protein
MTPIKAFLWAILISSMLTLITTPLIYFKGVEQGAVKGAEEKQAEMEKLAVSYNCGAYEKGTVVFKWVDLPGLNIIKQAGQK